MHDATFLPLAELTQINIFLRDVLNHKGNIKKATKSAF